MTSDEEIFEIKELIDRMRPAPCIRKMNEISAGVGAVMRFLEKNNGETTAGQISDFMHISTARVAAILKKMESNNLIVRLRGENDARVTVVRFTEYGLETYIRIRTDFEKQIKNIIDRVGMERLREFMNTFEEIKGTLTGAPKDIIEE